MLFKLKYITVDAKVRPSQNTRSIYFVLFDSELRVFTTGRRSVAEPIRLDDIILVLDCRFLAAFVYKLINYGKTNEQGAGYNESITGEYRVHAV